MSVPKLMPSGMLQAMLSKIEGKVHEEGFVSISRCLLSMEEGVTRLREAETDDDIGESFLPYICAWLELLRWVFKGFG